MPFPNKHVKYHLGRNKQPGTFQTPKLYTCQVSSKASLSFLLVLKFCTKGEILFEVSSRTPIEVNGLGFLPKGKDEDNQRKNTSAKCPVFVRPPQDFKTRQELVLFGPVSLCKELFVVPSVLSPVVSTNWPLNCTCTSPIQTCWSLGSWGLGTNLCCILVPSSLPSRFCCHSGHRYGEWRSHLLVDKTCCSQSHSNVLHKSHGFGTQSEQLLNYVSKFATGGLDWSCQSGMPSR